MSYKSESYQHTAACLIRQLEKRGMNGIYCATCQEAAEAVAKMIPAGSTVTWGGSETLEESGIMDRVRSMDVKLLDRKSAKTPEESRSLYGEIFCADYFLTGTNAITVDGELVNIDGNANRVAAIAYGPRNVLMIIGMNKVVRGQEEALSRAKYTAAPANAQRFSGTPCTVTGECAHCKSPECICCQTMITRYSKVPKRIKVILVNEDLGY